MIPFVLAVLGPTFGSPEFMNRLMLSHRTEYPAVFKLIDAARAGNELEFQKYVAEGATISLPDKAVPFTTATIHDLAMRCPPGDKIGTRILDQTDELSIYWDCPNDPSSPMTTLIFESGKVIHAQTGAAVVHVLPAPDKGSH